MHPGAVVGGKYRLTSFLGEGSMGSVWAAVHLETSQNVAVKLISGPVALAEELKSRLLREARACARIGHPNVVAVYDVGTLDDGVPFLVMQLLVGETLEAKLAREGRLDAATGARIGTDVARALAAAHAATIVHRDLKPANIFLHTETEGAPPVVKVLDFGVSKILAEGAGSEARATATGHAVGSPAYMSPEQARSANKVDPRSDVWALGVVLFEMLAGAGPFPGETAYAVVGEILHGPIPTLREVVPDVDPRLSELIGRCIVRDVNARIRTAEEVATALEAIGRDLGRDSGESASETTEPLGNNRLRAAVLGGGLRLSVPDLDEPLPPRASSPEIATPVMPAVMPPAMVVRPAPAPAPAPAAARAPAAVAPPAADQGPVRAPTMVVVPRPVTAPTAGSLRSLAAGSRPGSAPAAVSPRGPAPAPAQAMAPVPPQPSSMSPQPSSMSPRFAGAAASEPVSSRAVDAMSVSGSSPVYPQGSASSAVAGPASSPMYPQGPASGRVADPMSVSGSMPVYAQGPASGRVVDPMSVSGSMPVYAQGPGSARAVDAMSVSGSSPRYAQGSGPSPAVAPAAAVAAPASAAAVPPTTVRLTGTVRMDAGVSTTPLLLAPHAQRPRSASKGGSGRSMWVGIALVGGAFVLAALVTLGIVLARSSFDAPPAPAPSASSLGDATRPGTAAPPPVVRPLAAAPSASFAEPSSPAEPAPSASATPSASASASASAQPPRAPSSASKPSHGHTPKSPPTSVFPANPG